MEPLFPERPADWAALTADEINEFIAASQHAAEQLHARAIGADLTAAERLDVMTAGVAAIEAARQALAAREPDTDDAETEAQMEALAVQARGETLAAAETPDDGGDDDGDEDGGDDGGTEDAPAAAAAEPAEAEGLSTRDIAEAVAEGVAAALATQPNGGAANIDDRGTIAVTRGAPARSRNAAPAPRGFRPTLVAAAEGLGYALGSEIEGELALAAAMVRKRESFGHMTAREDVVCARLDWRDSYPAERRLSPADGEAAVHAKVQAIVASLQRDPNRLTSNGLIAAGGICAPVTPYYELQVISQNDRPVRAALPSFNADRGGIRFAAPPTLSDVDTAVGIVTAADDALGGTFATKTCQTLECPPFSEVDVQIIYHCIQTSNLTSRTFPEQMAQFNQLVLAAHARTAEIALLDGIGAASTAVTASDINLGASGALLTAILAAANGMRSRNRMDPDAVLRLLLPAWAVDLMVSDVIRTQFQRFDTDRERITALLRRFNVEPSFYIDGATGAGQIFGAQTAAKLLAFPATVVWYLFPEGTFLFLDGGVLELGLVRDSVLNATNEFQVFGETFENVAKVGVESIKVTQTVCDNGKVAIAEAVQCGDWAA